MSALLELRGIRKAFAGQRVLDDIDLSLAPGEIVSLLGPSGCGKSTLLRIIAGLDTAYQGDVCIEGQPPRLHSREVGFIFQEPRLLPWLTVAENVGFDGGKAGARDPRVLELLAEVGLGPNWEKAH